MQPRPRPEVGTARRWTVQSVFQHRCARSEASSEQHSYCMFMKFSVVSEEAKIRTAGKLLMLLDIVNSSSHAGPRREARPPAWPRTCPPGDVPVSLTSFTLGRFTESLIRV